MTFLPNAAFSQFTPGAKALGMGQAATAMPHSNWATFINPALIDNDQVHTGFYGLRNYGLTELIDIAAFASHPLDQGAFSAGFHRYGNDLMNETRIRAAYKYQWNALHGGIALNYTHIDFGPTYGSGGAMSIDAGIAAEVSTDLWMGARAVNISMAQYKEIDEDLPRELALGLSYKLNELAVFAIDMVKDVRFPVSMRAGIDVKVIKDLRGRIGVTTYPQTYSLGLGYAANRWEVNIAVQKHSLLDFSQGMDLIFYF